MSPDWPKRSTPSGTIALPATAPSQNRDAGWNSQTVTSAATGRNRASSRSATTVSPRARAASQSRCGRSSEVIARSPAFREVFGYRLVCCESLGGDGTAIGDRELGTVLRLAQLRGAADDRLGEVRVDHSPRLVDRPGRQPEMDRSAPHAGFSQRRSATAPRLVGIGGLEASERGQSEPVQRLAD